MTALCFAHRHRTDRFEFYYISLGFYLSIEMPFIDNDFVELKDCVFIKGLPTNANIEVSHVRYETGRVNRSCETSNLKLISSLSAFVL